MKKLEICCELSGNHLGSLPRALAIVDAAAEAGADLFKIQTWVQDTMVLDPEYTLTDGPWAGRKLFDLYRKTFTPWEWHKPIFDRARAYGMIPFSTAFDCASVDFLETLDVDRHKVASFEITDLPLIRYMAHKGKPMILSTGMASKDEICRAFVDLPDNETTVLKCTSSYPADVSDANLKTYSKPSTFYEYKWNPEKWGISDHSMGISVAVAAVALGAVYVEKHLTLSRADGGPDAGFSMEPHEFKQLVTECHRSAAAIGEVKFGPGPGESTELRRSLWVAKDIKAGDQLILGLNVVTARPALGMSPSFDLTGRTALVDLKARTPLTFATIL